MPSTFFDNKHLREYAAYGSAAGLFHILSVWYFLYRSNYDTSAVLIIGSIFFMFVIMVYALRLTKRRSENYSTWSMIIEGQMAVAVGIIVSVIGSFIICCFYLPEFTNSGGANDLLLDAPGGLHANNSGSLELIFATATIENYVAGAFISAIIAYAVKPDQTQDRTPMIFEEPAEPKLL